MRACAASIGALALTAGFAVRPSPACADEFHFEILRYGRRAMGMGGAVTAYADEPEASYYNPAGLAMVSGLRFSGSLHFIGLDERRMEGGLYNAHGGPSEDLESGDFVAVPSSSVLSKAFGEGGRNVVALSTFLASQMDEVFTGSHVDPVMGPAPFDENELIAEIERHDRTVLRGLSYARRVSDDLALGATLYWSEQSRRFNTRRAAVLHDRESEEAAFADAANGETTTVDGLLLRVGALWKATPTWALGLSCSSPSLPVYGEGSAQHTLVTTGDPMRDDAVAIYDNPREDDLEASSYVPANCRFGNAVRLGERWLLTADVSGHLPLDYTRFVLSAPARGGRPAREFRVEMKADPVVNGALGAEVRMAPEWPLRFGLFTNRTSAQEIPAVPPGLAPPHIDYYGATLSAGHLSRSTAVAGGVELQLGSGEDSVPRDFQSLLGDPSFVRVTREDWRLVFFLSGAVGLVEDRAGELLEGR